MQAVRGVSGTVARPARGDLVAAVSVTLVLVPQALAYATIAGLDPVYGLYAAVAAPLAGALVGSSPYLATGPVAVTSLLTFGALAPLAEPRSLAFAGLAAVLAVIVGLVRVGLGLVGAGPIAYLMSQPVVVSFTTAGALLIISTQVPGVLGMEAGSGNPLLAAAEALARPGAWLLTDILLGLGAVALLLGGRRLSPLFPGALVAVVAAVAWSHLTGYDGATVGEVKLGLALPGGFSAGDVLSLLVPGVVIAVVGFAEPASIARRYAAEDRQPWDSNKEFIGQGLANIASGAAGGFPVGGSFSRTALTRMSGGRTRWSGAFTGLLVLLVLPAIGLLAALPVAVLSGIVIGAVVSLIDLRAPLDYWRWSKPQLAVALVTFGATVLLAPQVERGVLIGVVAALAVHLWREMRVAVPAQVVGDTLFLRPSGVLYFGSAPAVERALNQHVSDHPHLGRVVLDLEAVGRLDLTGALMLRDLIEEVRAAGGTPEVRGAGAHAAKLLTRVLPPGTTVKRRRAP